ncbi:MAG: hypothetical protein AAGJ52_00455 [Pseudomonadota bacterium]
MSTQSLITVLAVVLTLSASESRANTVTTMTDVFQASGGLVILPDGDLIVADYGVTTLNPNGTDLYRVNPQGEVTRFASGFQGPTGNVIGPEGFLYQSSYVDGLIYRVSDQGSLEQVASGAVGPVGIEFNQAGEMIVANCNNSTIVKRSGGNLVPFINSGLLACPAGLAMDTDDNLYVTNYGNGHILKVTPSGQVSILATTPGGPTKPGGSNAHITFGNGKLYFVGSATHQVYSLTLDGELTVLAGDGEPGRSDGEGSAAEFSLPNGLDISADGRTLFLNDSIRLGDDTEVAPNVVRRIDLSDQPEAPAINLGMSGAWFEPETAGSGMFFDVIADQRLMFVGWYTWADDSAGSMISIDNIGSSRQRWLTALGDYNGSTADLVLYQSTGGYFDAPDDVQNEPVGTLQIAFLSCTTARADYVMNSGPSGSIALERLAADQLCQTLQSMPE